MKLKNILILAGGDGTRFWPLADKNTFSFLAAPLVTRIIRSIKEYTEHVVVVTNPSNNTYIQSISVPSLETVVVEDPGNSNMGKAVLLAENLIQGEVLVLNAVDIFDFTILEKFLSILKSKKKDYIFLAKEIKEYFPGAYVVFEGDKVKGFIEKPDPDKVPSNLTKLVVDYFSDFKRFVEKIKNTETEQDDLYEIAINEYITTYPNMDYIVYRDYWFTLKYPWHVLGMMSHYLHSLSGNHTGKDVQISKSAVITAPVYIEDNVKIGDFAKISGPAYIGESTIISDYSLVRESHIGRNVLVGSGCEVARSYLGDNVMLHRDYVGDSILDNHVLLGSGVVTANFRFDQGHIFSETNKQKIDTKMMKFGTIIGSDSKIGVNATVLPGVKIGKHTFVMSGEVVEQDIADDQFLHKGSVTPNKHGRK